MNKQTASDVSALMLEVTEKLNASVEHVRSAGSTEEFESYRSAVAEILGTVLLEVLNPIYAEHPELKPAELR